ncbi:DUF1425 domain-containing protein [Phycisphaerales bacterium AB-hyl4]|uniref:DUF1425 domain-containing protein n=1 Tax=Natronomicrosphaera hydrolytica TaxID=3242702 RepID=A0ABV4TZQ8_9BACT
MTTRTTLSMTVLTLTIAMLFVGCARTQPWGSVQDPVPQGQHPHIVLHDDIHNRVSHGQPTVTPSDGQTPMRVTVPLRLLDNRDHAIQYRFIFFDERNQQVRPEMSWRYKVLPPRAQTEVDAAALNPDAVDWRLEIRFAR